MRIDELVQTFGLQIVAGHRGLARRATDGYCGDLLSDVIAHAPEGGVWVTIQTHPNVIAVAVLRDMAAVIVTNGQMPDAATRTKADQEGIPLLLWPRTSFEIAAKLFAAGIGKADGQTR